MAPNSYLLDSHAAEHERLIRQALVWQPAARELFAEIGVNREWSCADVACGPVGVLPVLSECAGRVVGLDIDETALSYAGSRCWPNLELQVADALSSDTLPRLFQCVHARFLLAPVGRASTILTNLRSMLTPGGVLALQEPDVSTWTTYPRSAAFDELVARIQVAFSAAGGDLNAGAVLNQRLLAGGCQDVRSRRSVLALPQGHPYLQLPVQMAESLGTMPKALVEECRYDLLSRSGTTFTLVQCWTRLGQ